MFLSNLPVEKLNSATKYPSIPTYHVMGEKGRLTDEVQVDFAGYEVQITEKVDGTNVRVLIDARGHMMIGSRNELLWYSEDRLYNPALGIVDAMLPVLGRWNPASPREGVVVYFGELYGGKIGRAARQYTTRRDVTGFRIFDVLSLERCQIDQVMPLPVEDIAKWRDVWRRQRFVPIDRSRSLGWQMTPELGFGAPPAGVRETLEWLDATCPRSLCVLDDEAPGHPEGVIVRTPDRSRIAKIRFADYRRTLR